MRWPAGLDARRFLADYWQKKPLCLRGALPGFAERVTGDDLAALACEPEVESRLVLRGPEGDWTLRHGPFEEPDFEALPARNWTLLVQDVDKHLPPVAAVLESFRFLPSWRLDDVMISFAAPGGSVGPHLDAYDVFLLQGTGSRVWALDAAPADVRLRDDTPLRILRRFEPDERYTLAPGDLLYLPPGVAHHGVDDQPSLTWSIGFRAPSLGDLLREMADELDALDPAPRYADPDLEPGEVVAGFISNAAARRAAALLEAAAHAGRSTALDCLGRAATRPKPWLQPDEPERPPGPDALAGRLRAGARLHRHPAARIAWSAGVSSVRIYADGRRWSLPAHYSEMARRCASGETLAVEDLVSTGGGKLERRLVEVLAALHEQGSLELIGAGDETPAMED